MSSNVVACKRMQSRLKCNRRGGNAQLADLSGELDTEIKNTGEIFLRYKSRLAELTDGVLQSQAFVDDCHKEQARLEEMNQDLQQKLEASNKRADELGRREAACQSDMKQARGAHEASELEKTELKNELKSCQNDLTEKQDQIKKFDQDSESQLKQRAEAILRIRQLQQAAQRWEQEKNDLLKAQEEQTKQLLATKNKNLENLAKIKTSLAKVQTDMDAKDPKVFETPFVTVSSLEYRNWLGQVANAMKEVEKASHAASSERSGGERTRLQKIKHRLCRYCLDKTRVEVR